ncbi:multiple organellar RNA editing factor 7, mitochondrial [Vitis vinifera]|uniref:MORF/ORRM1/DAG-like MORF domain-containing protein n=1 Tax=Vitis vinifera TaxID=29760 RepID=D7TZR3_VITVI|eukprot:XP_002272872.1 PREDICTED: multiple organellar RNA editing factor 7, mitochondrial isoform X1 [Vitis vinifera]
MIRSLIRNPLQLTAVLSLSAAASNVRLSRCYFPLIPTSSFVSSRSAFGYFSSDSETQSSELTRLPTILDGCDYEHWLVVMEAPQRYPLRDEIVRGYIRTLAMVLRSEEEAKKSIYSVSTKYYYAFGCKIAENLAHQIKSLPNVKWVLPDSYLCHGGNGYGGEPFVNGEVVPYDEKYHADWLRDKSDDKCRNKTSSKKARRKRKNRFSKDQDV